MRGERKMIFQERDIEILQWVNGFGFASADQIRQFMKVGKRWSYFVGQVGGVFKVESRFNNYAAIA